MATKKKKTAKKKSAGKKSGMKKAGKAKRTLSAKKSPKKSAKKAGGRKKPAAKSTRFGKSPGASVRPIGVRSKIEGMDSIGDVVQAIKADHEDLKRFIQVMKDDDAGKAEKKEALENFVGLLES